MALAQRAHFGFNMPILYNARRHHKEAEERFNARYCDLDTLLQESDFVCLILPLTDETYHLFGAEQFAKMKSSAIFINAAVTEGSTFYAQGGIAAVFDETDSIDSHVEDTLIARKPSYARFSQRQKAPERVLVLPSAGESEVRTVGEKNAFRDPHHLRSKCIDIFSECSLKYHFFMRPSSM